ncbi:MAG: cysteine hydrolase [Candidatus Syntrophonatronum acetioxidans]|uniref:Cysteine hydrolase n=1 Tax=Candidatus Syntrophonatronum acetioxidans TaxID=1795816 RepID=A0A424YCZ4_9FIRM|nr:MAG: cysteine hydrolase [Candidatus Syntrophonatronum acetioxidans]
MKGAFLVIDMLKDFILPEGRLYIGEKGAEIIDPIKKHMQEARERRNHVIFICDRHFSQDGEFQLFPPHCLEGTQGAEVIEELKPARGDIVIPKRRFSSFFGTDLDLTLRELEVEELYLAGVVTNICILYTAADARMLNYKVNVYQEAVASFNPKAHNFALQEMKSTLGVNIL